MILLIILLICNRPAQEWNKQLKNKEKLGVLCDRAVGVVLSESVADVY